MSRQQGLRLGTKGPGVKTDCVSSFLLPKQIHRVRERHKETEDESQEMGQWDNMWGKLT